MSTSPDCSAVKRCCAVNGTYLTLSGSPNTAAEIARQMSILKPLYFPWLSGWPNPGVPACTPQVKEPACFTLSSVGPAWAGAANPSAAAKPATNTALTHFGIPCPPLCVAAPARPTHSPIDCGDASTAPAEAAPRRGLCNPRAALNHGNSMGPPASPRHAAGTAAL